MCPIYLSALLQPDERSFTRPLVVDNTDCGHHGRFMWTFYRAVPLGENTLNLHIYLLAIIFLLFNDIIF